VQPQYGQPPYGQPPYGQPPYAQSQYPNAKSKLLAGLLGIFLGVYGIHNFYLGYNGRALTQLLITVLTCGILGIFMWIWGLIEGIQILTGAINVDARGVPLKE
jgi:TM2 domain-containing membrane protein YozV